MFRLGNPKFQYNKDVTAGATGATAVAPKFSDTLTQFQPGGTDSAQTSQRSYQNFPHGYIYDIYGYLVFKSGL